jgi:hypothetical protein
VRSFILIIIFYLISGNVHTTAASPGAKKTTMNFSEGTITGMVVDKSTKKPLIGTNVTVKGIRLGAVTEQLGKFSINNIVPGTYTVVVEYIGYTL